MRADSVFHGIREGQHGVPKAFGTVFDPQGQNETGETRQNDNSRASTPVALPWGYSVSKNSLFSEM